RGPPPSPPSPSPAPPATTRSPPVPCRRSAPRPCAPPSVRLVAEKQAADIRILQQLRPRSGPRDGPRDEHVADVGELHPFLCVLFDHHDRLAFAASPIGEGRERPVDIARRQPCGGLITWQTGPV